ncbi:MAG: Ig-like domain-containing protein, partial [Thermoguttaceae bacterium]
QGEAVDNAPTFTSTAWNISSRDRTTATVQWSPPEWTTKGQSGPDQQTPDLAAVIGEIVNRPGWQFGNALALVITGEGKRVAESYNGDAQGAPLLYVKYVDGSGTPPNRPPTAANESANTVENTPVSVDVLANDTDPDNDPLTITIVDVTNGTALVNNGGTPADPTDDTVDFTPDVDFVGTAGFTYRVNDGEFDSNVATVTVSVAPSGGGAGTLDVRVADGTDDAEEEGSGKVSLRSSDLELTFDDDHQTVGMRFVGVDLPTSAIVTNAYVQFQVDETDSIETTLTIRGEATGDALTFTSTAGSITARPTTTAAVAWSPDPWLTVGEAGLDQRTPNIAAILQEIIAQPGWFSGNALAILIEGTGVRTAESYNGQPEAAPLLHIEYTVPAAVTLDANGVTPESAESLTEAQLMSIVDAAVLRLDPTDETEMRDALAGMTFEVVDLPDDLLGQVSGDSIRIDIDAAGYGWFIDPTPYDDGEFIYRRPTHSLVAMPYSPAANRADLLTVVMHELGHVAGYQHDDSTLMDALLSLGTRRLPDDPLEVHVDGASAMGPVLVDQVLREGLDLPLLSHSTIHDFLPPWMSRNGRGNSRV